MAEPGRPATAATARVGSSVGWSELGDADVSTLGAQVAAGVRLGRVALEAELGALTMLEYVEAEGGNDVRGELGRAGVNARFYLVDLVWPGSVDPDSLLRLYAEAGAGRQRGRWATGERFARNDVAIGGGWLLDHRMRPRAAGLGLRSIGWHFGWQLVTARGAGSEAAVYACKGCARPPMPGPELDLGLQVSCTLAASW